MHKIKKSFELTNSSIIDEKGRLIPGQYDSPPLELPFQKMVIEDFPFYMRSPHPLNSCLRNLRLKEWHFLSFYQEEHFISLAVVQLHYISLCFFYYFNFKTKQYVEKNLLSPLSFQTQFSSNSIIGKTSFKGWGGEIEIKGMNSYWELNLSLSSSSLPIKGNFKIERNPHALNLIYHMGKNRGAYTHKEVGNPVEGILEINQQKIPFLRGRALGLSDWSKGYQRRETRWHWAAFSQQIDEELKIGLNLSAKIYDDELNRSQENFMMIGNDLYPLDRAIFHIPIHPEKEDWHLISKGLGNSRVKAIDLRFTPMAVHQENKNFYFLISYFVQPVGYFNGIITLEDRQIIIQNAKGIMENHYSWW